MKFKLPLMLAASMLFSLPAKADFERWSINKESDPFTKGEKVVVDYMSSLRSGVLVFCDTAEPGIEIRAIPGFVYSPDMEALSPEFAVAIDGEVLFTKSARTGMVGDNLAISSLFLDDFDAKRFIDAFAASKKQIAIKDGIADKPHLLKASGSTKAGQALQACLSK